ncbi:MAG: extracellular solute-binding protein [Anaerolineae bacterium]
MFARAISRRRLLQVLSVSTIAGALAACGATATPQVAQEQTTSVAEVATATTAAPQTAAAGITGTVVVETRASENLVRWFNQNLEWLKAKQPGIQLEIRETPGAEYRQKMTVGLAAGTLGDLVWSVPGLDYEEYVGSGGLQDITPLIERDNFDLTQLYAVAYQAAQVSGKMYGLPTLTQPCQSVIALNLDLFEKGGATIPDLDTDTATILPLAQQLTLDKSGKTAADADFNAEQVTQFGLDAAGSWYAHAVYWANVIFSFGGQLLNSEGTKTTLQEAPAVDAMQWLADLRLKLRVCPSVAQIVQSTTAMFTNGQIAMLPIEPGAQATISQITDFKYAGAPVMKGPAGRITTAYSDVYCVTKSASSHLDAVWEYLKQLTSHESGILNAELFYPGARPDVWEDPSLQDNPKTPFHKIFAASFANTVPPFRAANLRQLQFLDMLTQNASLIWTGEASVQEGLTLMTQRADQVLAEPPLAAG